MVQGSVRKHLETGAGSAPLRIIGSVHEARDPGLNHCASTHDAGLERHENCGTRETMITYHLSSGTQSNYFRVSGRIAIPDGTIAGPGNNRTFERNDRTDRYLPSFRGSARFFERVFHDFCISGH